ncbi:DUF262 domain-containing protein [Commensalibacter sp. M0357]|uniref:GmrSD restriction endonuclease domain-containing protein n=1 Tax=unclassified Commensalibacter TaxID=2630218 RepID=UPI0018DCBBC6|nr:MULTISPECIES: DUF262 domain-containing protein [unclassified Commensalibacter]MBI0074301.1 DUF262 domain-containing protein [Commensalibacter sp. M0357]MBI0084143.1 DUF262 domain-containing protein [Commensalibacter sp. M0355]
MKQKKEHKISESGKEQAENQIIDFTKSIEHSISEFTVEILKNKLDRGDFFIPAYQREFTWDNARQSRFIESILMGLPIPFLFFWEDPESGILEIVDGSQRLRTLQSFMDNKLILNNLEKLDLLNNFVYNNLKESRQRKFKNKSIRGIILTEKTDLIARFDLFSRINTGSKIANPAEIRRAVLSGPFMDMIIELSEDNIVKIMIPAKEKSIKERIREELITRFFAYGDGLESYKDRPSDFLFNYVNKMNLKFQENNSLKKEYKDRLIKIFSFVKQYFPCGFKKREKDSSIPRVRFESIALGVFKALQEKPKLKPDKELIESIFDSANFKKEIRSDGANSINRINGRINAVKDILLQG